MAPAVRLTVVHCSPVGKLGVLRELARSTAVTNDQGPAPVQGAGQ
jgi:hypothetical protein